ncbi:MAG: antitoxin [Chromatiales bacterium]|nr:antitoxin [Chromatiales bacterium]
MTTSKTKRPTTPKGPKQPATAKVFMNGRSQAVRLPQEFRFSSDKVAIRREGANVVLSPLYDSWEEFFAGGPGFTPDFIDAVLNDDDLPPLDDRAVFD